jgi:hypothetical protein
MRLGEKVCTVCRRKCIVAAAPDALDPFKAETPLTLVPLRDEVIGALADGGSMQRRSSVARRGWLSGREEMTRSTLHNSLH